MENQKKEKEKERQDQGDGSLEGWGGYLSRLPPHIFERFLRRFPCFTRRLLLFLFFPEKMIEHPRLYLFLSKASAEKRTKLVKRLREQKYEGNNFIYTTKRISAGKASNQGGTEVPRALTRREAGNSVSVGDFNSTLHHLLANFRKTSEPTQPFCQPAKEKREHSHLNDLFMKDILLSEQLLCQLSLLMKPGKRAPFNPFPRDQLTLKPVDWVMLNPTNLFLLHTKELGELQGYPDFLYLMIQRYPERLSVQLIRLVFALDLRPHQLLIYLLHRGKLGSKIEAKPSFTTQFSRQMLTWNEGEREVRTSY